jgi:hypothetical protein
MHTYAPESADNLVVSSHNSKKCWNAGRSLSLIPGMQHCLYKLLVQSEQQCLVSRTNSSYFFESFFFDAQRLIFVGEARIRNKH